VKKNTRPTTTTTHLSFNDVIMRKISLFNRLILAGILTQSSGIFGQQQLDLPITNHKRRLTDINIEVINSIKLEIKVEPCDIDRSMRNKNDVQAVRMVEIQQAQKSMQSTIDEIHKLVKKPDPSWSDKYKDSIKNAFELCKSIKAVIDKCGNSSCNGEDIAKIIVDLSSKVAGVLTKISPKAAALFKTVSTISSILATFLKNNVSPVPNYPPPLDYDQIVNAVKAGLADYGVWLTLASLDSHYQNIHRRIVSANEHLQAIKHAEYLMLKQAKQYPEVSAIYKENSDIEEIELDQEVLKALRYEGDIIDRRIRHWWELRLGGAADWVWLDTTVLDDFVKKINEILGDPNTKVSPYGKMKALVQDDKCRMHWSNQSMMSNANYELPQCRDRVSNAYDGYQDMLRVFNRVNKYSVDVQHFYTITTNLMQKSSECLNVSELDFSQCTTRADGAIAWSFYYGRIREINRIFQGMNYAMETAIERTHDYCEGSNHWPLDQCCKIGSTTTHFKGWKDCPQATEPGGEYCNYGNFFFWERF
jgi:hypothetical protein